MHWNYSKLREKIRVTCGTQGAFAERLGIGRVSLNLRLNNKAEFSQEEIFKACEILGIAIKDIPAYFFYSESLENQTQKEEITWQV